MTKANKAISGLADKELDAKQAEIYKDLVKLRAQASTGTAQKNTMQIRRARRAVARIITLKRARELVRITKPAVKAAGKSAPQKGKKNPEVSQA